MISPRGTESLSPDELVVRTRFVPPRLRPHVVVRPRVDQVLAAAGSFPITVVKAEAGYGKTTAVASFLARSGLPHIWYNVADTEPDPRIYLLHLIHALRVQFPDVGARALTRLERHERSPRLWNEVVNSLSNDLLDCLTTDTFLVLDDYDRVNTAPVNAVTERLVETMPPLLHLVVTARTMPSLRNRARWRATHELLEVTRNELAFTTEEISALFAHRLHHPLSTADARSLALETEGWAIALQMLSDSLGGSQVDVLSNFLERVPGPSELLFDYLAEEVFLRQPEEVQRFLGESACLRRLDVDACNHILEMDNAADVLRLIENSSLFVSYDDAIRYHNLFADFLVRRSGVTRDRRNQLHRRAASYYSRRGDDEEAVFHLLAAGDNSAAADILAGIAGPMARTGRHHALSSWLDQIPAEVLARSPELLVARGETYRLDSRFADALPVYQQARALFRMRGDRAGEIRSVRGQALLYLDTVQPALAEPLLREALRMTNGFTPERAALLAMLAENRLNAGQLRRAERLYRALQQRRAAGEPAGTDPRLYLRTGRFAEAIAAAEAGLAAEPTNTMKRRQPRSHREATALLSWIHAMRGAADLARSNAQQALDVARTLNSPINECVAYSRLGLAWLSGYDFDTSAARAHFADALRSADRIGVDRFRVESLLGHTLISGIEENVDAAQAAAREALEILARAGDEYLRAVVTLALGGALALCREPEAEAVLLVALADAEHCGDRYLPCVAQLWLALHRTRSGHSGAQKCFNAALQSAQKHDYGFVFAGRALLAPKDTAAWRPLLKRAMADPAVAEFARKLALELDPSDQTVSSGIETVVNARLYVQTLGPFRVWRNGQEIQRTAWAREKAQHLLQLLLCHRGRVLHREQILEELWPKQSPTAAATGLRVALSALRNALEPDRATGSDGVFVVREGDTIRLAIESGIRIDADELSRLIANARAMEDRDSEDAVALYESALALYRGEFLSETRYARWAEQERLHRRTEFLDAAQRVAALHMRAGAFQNAARWAETMLQHDPLWEAAYTILMEAYWRLGNRALALRAFNRCRRRLHDQLGVRPSHATTALYDRISTPDSPQPEIAK